MTYINHNLNNHLIAEIHAPGTVIGTAQQFLEVLMGSTAERFILHQENLDARFFDLRNGLAGDMLQKLSNYRLRMAIVGDFSMYDSTSQRAFIAESNRSNTVVFVGTMDEALERMGAPWP